MTGYWVRDLLRLWHKAATDKPDGEGRYFVRCLTSVIDVGEVGLPGAGAEICDDCMDEVEREKTG